MRAYAAAPKGSHRGAFGWTRGHHGVVGVQADWLEAPDDDVLDLRPWRPPRWPTVVLVVGALVAVAVAVLTRAHGQHHPARAALPSASPVATTIAQTAVVSDGSTYVVLVDGQLVARDLSSGHLRGSAPLPSGDRTRGIALFVDPSRALLWAVNIGAVPATLSEYRLPDLAAMRQVVWPPIVLAAAAFAGHLYVTTSVGVADLGPDSTIPRPIPGLSGAVGPITADPARHRIIALDLGYPTDMWTYRPGGAPQKSHTQLRLADGSVEVAGDQIWIAGHQDERPVLWRLDPSSLAPVVKAQLPDSVRTRAVVVAAGSRVLWLRALDDQDSLYCVDATGGAVLQTWRVRGAVDSVAGQARVDTPDGVAPLHLSGCPG
jgi:outer membrane protein assembly factor BamB